MSQQHDNSTGFAQAFENAKQTAFRSDVDLSANTGTADVNLMRNLPDRQINRQPRMEAALAAGDDKAINPCADVLAILKDAHILKN